MTWVCVWVVAGHCGMCSKESTKEGTKLKQEERDYIILEWVLLNERDLIELTAIRSGTHTQIRHRRTPWSIAPVVDGWIEMQDR